APSAKYDDARRLDSLNLDPQQRQAGGKDQLRKRNALFIFDLEFAAAEIDLGGSAVIFQRHAPVAPPAGRVELDVMGSGLARKHRRQQHAVVSQTRLGADHSDGETAERNIREFVDQTRG